MHPPHLPNKTCSLALHQAKQRMAIILLAVVFGLVGGVTGTSMAIGWIWPDLGGGNYWLVSQVDRTGQKVFLEEIIKKETEQKIMTVYPNTQKIGEVFYFDNNNKLGEAIVVGSDGWLAMYLENERDLINFQFWRVLNFENRIFQVSNQLYDKQTNILYFKIKNLSDQEEIKNEQFKVMGFSEDFKNGDSVFVNQRGSWQTNFLEQDHYLTEKQHLDSTPLKLTILENKNIQAGSVIINKQGRLLGFVNKEGEMLGSVYMARILPGILNKQQIIYPTFMVEGWYSVEKPIFDQNGSYKGFLVTNVLKNEAKLQKGDIILEINGQIVENENLWYNLRGEKARLKILRRGKFLDIEAQIKENIFK